MCLELIVVKRILSKVWGGKGIGSRERGNGHYAGLEPVRIVHFEYICGLITNNAPFIWYLILFKNTYMFRSPTAMYQSNTPVIVQSLSTYT